MFSGLDFFFKAVSNVSLCTFSVALMIFTQSPNFYAKESRSIYCLPLPLLYFITIL